MRKNGNRIEIRILLCAFINSFTIFCPRHGIVELLHQVIFVPKLYRSFLKVPLCHFALASFGVLNKKDLTRASRVDELVEVIVEFCVVYFEFWIDDWVRHVLLWVIRE
jgi:hypothetical protein